MLSEGFGTSSFGRGDAVGIDIRQKGAEGEREVIRMLTPVIIAVMREMEYPQDAINTALLMVQRNQNQSAVGGNDLSNTFGMSIEVKRQEQLSVNTWWAQCEAAANRNNEIPVLMYRQNRKAWRIRTYGFLHVQGTEGGWSSVRALVEFDEPTFKVWFKEWVKGKLLNGYEVKV
jgi:hypothetical protein